jgi:hypothetical protein
VGEANQEYLRDGIDHDQSLEPQRDTTLAQSAELLANPFEESLHPPTVLLDPSNGICWGCEVVGQGLEPLLRFDIEVTDSARRTGIGSEGIDRGPSDGEIRSRASRFIHRRVDAPLSKTFSLGRTTKNAEQSVNTSRRSKSM